MQPNWPNRTTWTGDNLDIVRGMNSDTVDLIYLDLSSDCKRCRAHRLGSGRCRLTRPQSSPL